MLPQEVHIVSITCINILGNELHIIMAICAVSLIIGCIILLMQSVLALLLETIDEIYDLP